MEAAKIASWATPDRLFGGEEDDTLRARDSIGGNDDAYGGPGKDAVYADRGDLVKD